MAPDPQREPQVRGGGEERGVGRSESGVVELQGDARREESELDAGAARDDAGKLEAVAPVEGHLG